MGQVKLPKLKSVCTDLVGLYSPILNDVLITGLDPSMVFFINEGLPLSSYDIEYCIATSHPVYCVCLLLGG